MGGNFIQSKLDRAFTNMKWIDLWPTEKVEYIRGTSSDHASMDVTISEVEKGNKPFKIFYSWMESPHFITLSRQRLATRICGNGMFRLRE